MLNILQLTQLSLFAMNPVFKLGVLFTISVCSLTSTKMFKSDIIMTLMTVMNMND